MQFPITETEKQKNKARVDFRLDEFRKLMVQKGLNVTWYQSAHCPCFENSNDFGLNLRDYNDTNSKTGHNRTSCPVCKGTGTILHSAQTIRVIATQSKGDVKHGMYGQMRDEFMDFTFYPEHLPSYGDHIVLNDSVIVWRELYEKSSSNLETLSHPIVQRDLVLTTGEKTVGVLYLHVTDTNGNQVAERIQDVHFGITNGKIDWTKGTTPTPPPVGSKYSIAYYVEPHYVIIDHPHSVRDTVLKNRTTLAVETPAPLLVQARAKLILN